MHRLHQRHVLVATGGVRSGLDGQGRAVLIVRGEFVTRR